MLNTGDIIRKDDYEYRIIEMIGRGANTVAYLAERKHDGLVSKCILKEYSPAKKLTDEEYEIGRLRFINSGRTQNDIRQLSALNNQTPPVTRIFETKTSKSAQDFPKQEVLTQEDFSSTFNIDPDDTPVYLRTTPYIEVSCYGGTTLSKLKDLSLLQYMEIILTVAKTIGYYHKSGYLCLDIKPENIFIMQNTPDHTITQLVEFIDFDSIRKTENIDSDTVISCTKDWAAPELLNSYATAAIGSKADIYTVGELVFYYIFGRHSSETEHRGFSKYRFSECRKEYRKFTDRPDIQSVLTRFFRGTIRSSASNRFNNMSEIENLLTSLIECIGKKDYIIPKLPAVSPNFVGRDKELKYLAANLKENHVLFLSGIGGIGKSTLIRKFINLKKSEYEILIYIEYDCDFRRSFTDDIQLQISTIRQTCDEDTDEYFNRKLKALKNICADKKVLFVVDNFSGRITKDLSLILDCGFDTIIVTRNDPPKNSFNVMKLEAIADPSKLFGLITLNLERPMTKDEHGCFEEIINLVQGHTLTLELIARQIAKGRINIDQALFLMRENGFSHISHEKISNYKDGEEVYGTLNSIITALFEAGNLAPGARFILKVLALLDARGMDREIIRDIVRFDMDMIRQLSDEGWLYDGSIIRLHPVISEAIRNWSWDDLESDSDSLSNFCKMNDGMPIPFDITVMKYHKDICDIYHSCDNEYQLNKICKEAEKYSQAHPRHIIKAFYHDIMGTYYDTCTHGIYVPYTKEEEEPLIYLLGEADSAIEEMEQSEDPNSRKFLPKLYLDLAMILIRGTPDGGEEAAELLNKTKEMLNDPQIGRDEDRCYFDMITAWYYTLIEPDLGKMTFFAQKAADIAPALFTTDIEIIDIIYVPTANCLFFLDNTEEAGNKLEDTIDICRKHPSELRYIEKLIDLKIYQLDVYKKLNDVAKCQILLDEINNMNEAYREQGVFREIPQETKEELEAIKY